MEDHIEENKIIDEALKHITKDRIRIEDMKKMAEDDGKLIDRLTKFVLNEILESCKKQGMWAMSHGAGVPDPVKINFSIQHMVLAFIRALTERWLNASTYSLAEANIRDFKEILGEKK